MSQEKLSAQIMSLKPSDFGNLLPSPYEQDLGSEEKGVEAISDEKTISVEHLEIRLGDRPFSRNLQKLYELSGKKVPPDVAVFDRYDIWLLTHSIGAINRQGDYPKILSLGYQANFEDVEEVYTIEMLPRTKFITKVEIKSQMEIALGLEGHAQVPQAVTALLEQIEYIGADASIKLASDQKIVGKLSFKIMTPIIQAVGIGKSQCEWLFELDEEPLLGDQIMIQTILVPKDTPIINYKVRGYALIKTHWIRFPAMFDTEWINVSCKLG